MFLLAFLAFSLSVLLASNASILSTTDDVDPTTTFRGFSFAAKATPNADKGSSDNHTLLNEANMEVNVGGHGILLPSVQPVRDSNFVSDFTLIIDTGSSDLWVTGGQKLKLNSTTNTTVNLTYGIGSAYGNIAYAPVAFERTTKNTSAQSVMANLFAQSPSTPHMIGLALERSEDGEDTAGGYLSIGDYDPHYINVTYTPKNPVTPTSASRWTIAMEAMTVNRKRYPLSSGVKGTKKGQAITLIDSGTSLAYIPNDAVDAIYGQFSGSVHVKTSGQDAWFVPCLGQVNLSFTFAGATYPINPMELTSPIRVVDHENQYTVCINAFRPSLAGTQHELDFLLGDIFMRNVYSVFNFGNETLNHTNANTNANNADVKGASIQLLSRTNQDQVYTDFQGHRKNVLKVWPPLFDLSKLHSDGTTDGGGRLEPPSED
ncbi:aspartic peptidase domain-containing protein [Boletus reticuloceps]|uniref:Aspartic peptidase domain-containing protein n=1 Tax=Boletus reticuloceps TaxID=495285 RepID=A0A8I3A9Y6_9AGAM|nr:aspartic peptidase domain-containing protein [Boletus reticuloceps]